jgi:lipopolysaccharide transport system ATP-binding protein
MTKDEIDRKFDEIVAFSGVEKFIDTPVKRYSSGMRVRLGFSVAAHLDPEILLIDEVLAVGDAGFQKKCLGKMGDVAKEGRTVLFVSHRMGAIRNLCKRTLLLDYGQIQVDGPTEEAIDTYIGGGALEGAVASAEDIQAKVTGKINVGRSSICIKQVALMDKHGEHKTNFNSDEEIKVSVTYECLKSVNDLRVAVSVVDEQNDPILVSQNADSPDYLQTFRREPGVYRSVCTLPANTFGHKRFYLTVHLVNPGIEELTVNKVLSFNVTYVPYNNINYYTYRLDWIRPRLNWATEHLTEGGR